MPVQWNVPYPTGIFDQQNVEQFNRLPVWMAKQQTQRIPYWSRWKQKYATIKWEPNMGDILQGIMAEPSPKTVQSFTPRNITEVALKTVVAHYERSNTARIKHHKFESPQFHFLPSFRDFRDKQLKFASDDLSRQIGMAYDDFVRWQILQQSPYIYICGATQPYTAVAYGEATDTSSPKGTAEMVSYISQIGAGDAGYLDFRQMCAIRAIARNTILMPPWEGMKANPGENETVKGKYILTGEPSLYEALTFDIHVLNTRDLPRDLLNSEFSGIISGNIAFMAERYPLLMADDGTFPGPEVELQLPALTYGSNFRYETVPNPPYVGAVAGWAFFEGYNSYETIDIGPPPKEFAGKSISVEKFNSLQWNGEVRMIDDILIDYGNGITDTNKYGEFLQLISYVTLGIIANTNRYCLPVLYRRNLTPSLNVQ